MSWLARIRCRLGRHDWDRHFAGGGGLAVAIYSCTRCGKIDVDSIEFSGFNRTIRRNIGVRQCKGFAQYFVNNHKVPRKLQRR